MAAVAIIKQMTFEHRRSPFVRNDMVFWWWWIVADAHHLTQFTYNEGRTPAKQINALLRQCQFCRTVVFHMIPIGRSHIGPLIGVLKPQVRHKRSPHL